MGTPAAFVYVDITATGIAGLVEVDPDSGVVVREAGPLAGSPPVTYRLDVFDEDADRVREIVYFTGPDPAGDPDATRRLVAHATTVMPVGAHAAEDRYGDLFVCDPQGPTTYLDTVEPEPPSGKVLADGDDGAHGA